MCQTSVNLSDGSTMFSIILVHLQRKTYFVYGYIQ